MRNGVDRATIKKIAKRARRARGEEVHRLYVEVYGADFSRKVTEDRARKSIQEACAELLAKKKEE
jgi:hypothetical protein